MTAPNKVTVTVYCSDCGEPFDTRLIMGRQVFFYCRSCAVVHGAGD